VKKEEFGELERSTTEEDETDVDGDEEDTTEEEEFVDDVEDAREAERLDEVKGFTEEFCRTDDEREAEDKSIVGNDFFEAEALSFRGDDEEEENEAMCGKVFAEVDNTCEEDEKRGGEREEGEERREKGEECVGCVSRAEDT
jgi:hypothetical protein